MMLKMLKRNMMNQMLPLLSLIDDRGVAPKHVHQHSKCERKEVKAWACAHVGIICHHAVRKNPNELQVVSSSIHDLP